MNNVQSIPIEVIENKIFLIRGQKVMLDRDLAQLYGTETRTLKQAVKRNLKRFPPDFMFQLSKEEFTNWRSQIVMSKSDEKGLRHLPFAFTEQGVAMLSSVLNSERAVEVNILIIRAFVKLREILSTHKELAQKLKDLELKLETHDEQITLIIAAINQLLKPPPEQKKKWDFR
ncbi:MAG: ORF6N domain-containing protein [Bacteroidetes bacterium]|nr:ORF6N domain-containing protein [Bacteroidota bacterium]